MVKNESAFQSGSRKLCAASRTSRAEKRDGLLGVVDAEVPAQRVGAGLVDHRHRLDHVAEPLRHLAALLVVDVAEDDAVLEGRRVEEQRRRATCRV